MTVYRVRELLRGEALRHAAMSSLDTDTAMDHSEVAQAMQLASEIILHAVIARESKKGKGPMGRIGKKIKFIPHSYGKTVEGVVVWVHPKRRFVDVEYRVPTPYGMSAPIRQSLPVVNGIVWTGI